jgi:hypothetical protein
MDKLEELCFRGHEDEEVKEEEEEEEVEDCSEGTVEHAEVVECRPELGDHSCHLLLPFT